MNKYFEIKRRNIFQFAMNRTIMKQNEETKCQATLDLEKLNDRDCRQNCAIYKSRWNFLQRLFHIPTRRHERDESIMLPFCSSDHNFLYLHRKWVTTSAQNIITCRMQLHPHRRWSFILPRRNRYYAWSWIAQIYR